MTLEKFIEEILQENAKKYTEEEIKMLFKISLTFSNAFFHIWKKEKNKRL